MEGFGFVVLLKARQRHLSVLLRGREGIGRTDWEKSMSVELISVLVAVVAVGATLGGLILASNLGESERRRRTIGVRVTATEEAELRERAQAARLSMGA